MNGLRRSASFRPSSRLGLQDQLTWPNNISIQAASARTFRHLHALGKGEIRLMTIIKGGKDERFQCRFTYHKLEHGVKYFALSYAWGFVDITHAIECDGQEVLVSKNLYTALCSLHHLGLCNSDTMPIWIDALCINQKDEIEKTQQVRMMSTIYKRAEQVFGWLGEETEADRRGFEVLEKVWQILDSYDPNNEETTWRVQRLLNFKILDLEPLGLPDLIAPEWNYVKDILEKPWFSRVWIIQEFFHAKDFLFLCGGSKIEPHVILHSIRALFESSLFTADIMNHRTSSQSYRNAPNLSYLLEAEKLSFAECLVLGVHFEASDPRDKIFAMVSLSENTGTALIDYTQNIETVLISTGKECLESGLFSLDMLSFSQALERKWKVPSWVPAWSSTKSIFVPLVPIQHLLNPDPPDTGRSFHVDNSKALVISSHTFDCLKIVTDFGVTAADLAESHDAVCRKILSPELSPEDRCTAFGTYQTTLNAILIPFRQTKAMIDNLPSYPTGQPVSEVFWHSLLHDNDHSSAEVPLVAQIYEEMFHLSKSEDWAAELSEIRRFNNLYVHWDHPNPSRHWLALGPAILINTVLGLRCAPSFRGLTTLKQVAKWAGIYVLSTWTVTAGILFVLCFRESLNAELRRVKWVKRIQQWNNSRAESKFNCNGGRRLFITEKGYIAWAPKWAKKGDEICRFEGARLPYIVRRTDAAQGDAPSESYELLGDIYLHGLMGRGALDALQGEKKRIRIV